MKKIILLVVLATVGIGGYMLLTKSNDDAGKGSANNYSGQRGSAPAGGNTSPANTNNASQKPASGNTSAKPEAKAKTASTNTDTNTDTKTGTKTSTASAPTRPGGNSPQNAAFQMQSALSNSARGRQNLTSNATQIEAVKILQDNYSAQLPILAKIQAKVTDSITAPSAARVMQVKVNAGDVVQKGQLLVELDASDLQLSITAQKAAVAQQESNIRIAKLQHENDLALLENAKNSLKKEQNLLKGGFSNETNIESATDKLRSAQLTVDLFEEQKISRETSLTTAKVSLQKLQTQLDDYLIVAPYDAKVIDLNAFVNQKLKAGDSVITLIDQNSLMASGQIPASKHHLLSLNQTNAFLTQFDQTTQLNLTYLASNADRGAIDVEFLLPQNQDFVVGDTVELKINLKAEQSFIVPSDSIYQGQYVYLVRNNKLQQTKVSVLGYQFKNDTQWTLIQSDNLKNDDQILATRLSSPATGTSVNVIKELAL